ncbi:MAG TPA: peptidoglycan-binding domain-containing protein [Xanthobacteraceae bacterium]|nr:peptidoglycan-binding domain-containing protein [Xanthobacteraceae bacterium]
MAIQADLIWTGDLNSIADGAWGERSTGAVKAFQKRKGGKETGVLSPDERSALAADAAAARAEVGWRTVIDESGARLGIPNKLAPRARKGKTGGIWQSPSGDVQIEVFREPAPATLAAIYQQERKNPARKITYSVRRPDFFVISGMQGANRRFYMRAQAGAGELRGFTIVYAAAKEDVMARVVVAVASDFTAFPAAAADGRPLEKRKVEYATGIVVSAAGDIVTDRKAIEDCQVIVVAGIGSAARVAEDSASGLALIRVYGPQKLAPLPLGGAPRREFTLVGIADPHVQAGNASTSAVPSRVAPSGDTSVLDPTPAQGFAGAAAIDAEAGFVGVAVQKAQVVAGPATAARSVTLVGSDAVRNLLTANNVVSISGQAQIDAARQSVVRVICVRK